MGQRNTKEDFESQFNDVISRLESKQFFQSEWDIGFGVVFLVFIGEWHLTIIKTETAVFPLNKIDVEWP